jgi:antitoxin FitA
MATLYVENVPDELYKALRKRAKGNRRSIAAEVITLLEEQVPTGPELQRRRDLVKRLERLRSITLPGPGPFQTSEEMVREDRGR